MTRPSVRWRAIACGVAIVLGVSACTTDTPDGPGTASPAATASASVVDTSSGSAVSSSPTPSRTPSVIDVPTPSSAPPVSLDPAAQEAADRAAIEAQWVKFWAVYATFLRIPKDQRLEQLDAVAVPPIADKLLKAADEADRDGIDNYGSVTHRLSWQFPVDGKPDAVIADCQDQSTSGTLKVVTGEIQTVGKARSNMRGQFVKSTDNMWRLSTLFFLEEAC